MLYNELNVSSKAVYYGDKGQSSICNIDCNVA